MTRKKKVISLNKMKSTIVIGKVPKISLKNKNLKKFQPSIKEKSCSTDMDSLIKTKKEKKPIKKRFVSNFIDTKL